MITPAPGRVLIRNIKRDTKTSSGIMIGGSALQQENLLYGEIVSVSEFKIKDEPEIPLKVGDKVFYSRYSATTVGQLENNEMKEYEIVSTLDIMAYEIA